MIITYNKTQSQSVGESLKMSPTCQSISVSPKLMTGEEVAVLQKKYLETIEKLAKQLALKETECDRIHYRYIQATDPSQQEVGNYYGPSISCTKNNSIRWQ